MAAWQGRCNVLDKDKDDYLFICWVLLKHAVPLYSFRYEFRNSSIGKPRLSITMAIVSLLEMAFQVQGCWGG